MFTRLIKLFNGLSKVTGQWGNDYFDNATHVELNDKTNYTELSIIIMSVM